MKSTSAWVLASCLLVACGGDDTTGGGAGTASPGSGGTSSTGSAGTSSTGSGGTSSTGVGGDTGGTSATGGSGGTGVGGAAGSLGVGGALGGDGGPQLPADETMCGMVMLTANKVIPASKITSVCAGAVITASMGVSISVLGTLRVEGTAAAPVTFNGTMQKVIAWTGIVIQGTGTLSMTYGQIDDAAFAIDAKAGSKYDVDHLVLNSEKMLNLASAGTINHGVFHARGARQKTIGDPIVVVNASPHISNVILDLGGGVDYVNVSGATSAAVFDHMDMTGAHCAFHFDGGNGNTISNSNIHGNSFGLMVEGSSNNTITHNNFTGNNPNIGDCGTGSSAMVKDNYFQGPAFATNCPKLTSATPAPAAYPLTGAGAVGVQP